MKVSQIDIQSSVACIEKHGYKLRSLPANWRDSFWQKLQDRCALTDPELICLQYEVIKRNGKSLDQLPIMAFVLSTINVFITTVGIFNGVYLGVGSAKTAFQLLKAKNVTEEELPLNIHDKKWQAIQKKCGIESIDWAAFRYTAAVVRLGMYTPSFLPNIISQFYTRTIHCLLCYLRR